jgi:Fe-S-cluster-containing hydrogenase component 2
MLLELEELRDEFTHGSAVLPYKEKCVGCIQCAVMCPDIAINVYSRQKNELAGEASKVFRLYSDKVESLMQKLS